MNTPFTLTSTPDNASHASPLVLVHGSWGSSAMWSTYIHHFKMHGWHTHALDLRGHGKSNGDVAGATMGNYMEDVARVVEENGLASPIVIGHSMGGLVALMYGAKHGARAIIAIGPSPSAEVQGEGEEKKYPAEYTPMDAGMPTDPMEAMQAFPDIPQEMLMKMKDMLGMESGVARSERKRGISVPKERLSMPVLFVGSELGESAPFGIGIETAKAMSQYYEKEVLEIKGATHPGILMGHHAAEAAEKIEAWLDKNTT